jgi:FkbM family methyltransferase
MRSILGRIPGVHWLNQRLTKARLLIPTTRSLMAQGNGIAALWYYALSLANSKRPVRLTVRSRSLLIRPNTPDLRVAETCFDGEFAAAIRAATPLYHHFIIDAGGYIGTAAIVLAEAFPNARIISLEPSLENYAILYENVGKYRNVTPLAMAVSSREQSVQLRNRGTGEWGFSIVPSPADCLDAAVIGDGIEATTIPKLVEMFNATGIDILKLDVEGAEYDLLKDSFEWINDPRVIITELHEHIVPGVTEVYRKAAKQRIPVERDGEKEISVLTD